MVSFCFFCSVIKNEQGLLKFKGRLGHQYINGLDIGDTFHTIARLKNKKATRQAALCAYQPSWL
jgi:hypothetical protein